jgi:Family of unknown function (DUF6209)
MARAAAKEAPVVAAQQASVGAALEFSPGRETQNGDITQNGRFTLIYDPSRLPYIRNSHNGMPAWDIIGNLRFHPGLETYSGSVVQKMEMVNGNTRPLYPPAPLPLSVPVPPDAMAVEIWFLNTGLFGEKSWDSRYGQNYWFGVAQAGPAQPVSFRAGAIRDISMVNVLNADGKKVRRSIGGSPQGSQLETELNLTAWMRNIQYQKNVWIDFHVFDGNDDLVHAETLPLSYREPGGGGGDIFAFERRVFKGSGGLPGAVWPRPDARLLQFRLYYEVAGQVFTDGHLHESTLPADAEGSISLATAA